MCFDVDSRPPEVPADLVLRPIAGGAAAEVTELESADGTVFSVAVAEAPEPVGAAVVVLPDVRGLHPFYVELAERFAGAGHHCAVLDFFGRTAGTGVRGEDFEWMPHVLETTPETIQLDLAATVAELRTRAGGGPVVVLGFCFGGSQTLLASTNRDLDVDGFIPFYGGLDGTRLQFASPKDHAAEMRGPILGLYGGADQGIPAEAVDRFGADLTAAGVEHEIVVYPGAPHSFFDRKQEEFADASADAWRRVLEFARSVPAR